MLTVDFDRLGVKPNDLLLDAGCGEGRHSVEGVLRGARVLSMDMDIECLKKANFKMAFPGGGASSEKKGDYIVHIGDALNLPYKNETFDRIICSEVMEHVRDDNHACSELARVLKRGGTIAITVPTFLSELLYDGITYEYFTSPGGHIRKYLPGTIARIMRQNGLTLYWIGFRHSFHTIYWLIRCVVGLHLEDHPFTRTYKAFLFKTVNSRLMERVEQFFDYFFPKSMILYAVKK